MDISICMFLYLITLLPFQCLLSVCPTICPFILLAVTHTGNPSPNLIQYLYLSILHTLDISTICLQRTLSDNDFVVEAWHIFLLVFPICFNACFLRWHELSYIKKVSWTVSNCNKSVSYFTSVHWAHDICMGLSLYLSLLNCFSVFAPKPEMEWKDQRW